MLKLNGQDFAVGRSCFADASVTEPEGTAKIYVKIVPGDLQVPVLAQLDTGSPWSILEPELAEALGLFSGSGVAIRLGTRLGSKEGHLVKVSLTLPADEGQSVTVDQATVFVCREWPAGKNFVGYGGLIEFIRVALDPQQNMFYFGGY